MANHMEYYKKEIKELKDRVSKCDNQMLDSLEFFLKESNTHMAGISRDVEETIYNEIHKFKENCKCKRSSPKKLEDIETAEEFIMTGYKR